MEFRRRKEMANWMIILGFIAICTIHDISAKTHGGTLEDKLRSAGLKAQTLDLLKKHGFDSLLSLSAMEHEDIEDIGIEVLAQKRLLKRLLDTIKEEYNSKESSQWSENLSGQDNQVEIKKNKHTPLRSSTTAIAKSSKAKSSKQSWYDWAYENRCTLIGAGLGLATAPVAGPAVLAGAGFTKAGIAAGSLAAKAMSAAAVAGGTGGVAAGGVVATLQAAGAAGVGATVTAASSVVGGIAGALLGKSSCTDTQCQDNND